MIKLLDLYKQYQTIHQEIDEAIRNTIQTSAYIGGEGVTAFEKEFSEFQSAKYTVGVGNGTDAIEIAIESLDLPINSEIIVPANSFIASSEAISRQGHRVVFADIDPETYTLDPDEVTKRITSKTKAVLAVHLYGQPCRMDKLKQICEINNLKLIEDCAQAHGAEYQGRRVGAIGHIGTFSFYPGKNLGAYGDGGAITTDDVSLAKKCRMIANHGRINKYDHQFEGRNSRLDGIQAAILRVKLRHLATWLMQRRRIAKLYTDGLKHVGNIGIPIVRGDSLHAYHLYVIRTSKRNELAEFLKQRKIETGIHYPIALPKLKAYEYLNQYNEPMIANKYDSQLLSLPIGEHLTDDEVQRVIATVKEYFS